MAESKPFWAGLKGDLKWASVALFFFTLTGGFLIPPVIRFLHIDDLLERLGFSINAEDGGWAGWYGPTDGAENMSTLTTEIFGQDRQVVPFEILSVLLLAALIAGVVIALREPEGGAP